MLINCSTSVDFLTLFQNWWWGITHENILLTATQILYGWYNRTKHWQFLNYAILIAKYCIFCTSLRGETLCFRDFLLRIQEKLQILKQIATAQNSLPKFHRTWEVIILIVIIYFNSISYYNCNLKTPGRKVLSANL